MDADRVVAVRVPARCPDPACGATYWSGASRAAVVWRAFLAAHAAHGMNEEDHG